MTGKHGKAYVSTLQTFFMIYTKNPATNDYDIDILNSRLYFIYNIFVGWDVRISPISRITIMTVFLGFEEGTPWKL